MSLYNLINGYHPMVAPLLSECLGFDTPELRAQIPRFRDVFLFEDQIRLLTRTGGGNRPDYEDENEFLRQWPGFIRDWDDAYDSTFAWWAYSWPKDEDGSHEALTNAVEAIKEKRPDLLPVSLEEITNRALDRMTEEFEAKHPEVDDETT